MTIAMLRRRSLLAVALVFVMSCSPIDDRESVDFGTTPTPTPESTDTTEPITSRITTVAVMDNMFEPKTVEIRAGDPVEWVWGGKEGGETARAHNVVSDIGSYNSGPPQRSGTFPWSFPAAGTFTYHCQVHGGQNGFGMSGTVIVKR